MLTPVGFSLMAFFWPDPETARFTKPYLPALISIGWPCPPVKRRSVRYAGVRLKRRRARPICMLQLTQTTPRTRWTIQ